METLNPSAMNAIELVIAPSKRLVKRHVRKHVKEIKSQGKDGNPVKENITNPYSRMIDRHIST